MTREIFKIKNISGSLIELNDFGIIIPNAEIVDLLNFDKAVSSNELYNYLNNGDLVRVIDGVEITDINYAYDSSTRSYGINTSIDVAKSGGTFTTITDALNYITDNSDSNRYVINVSSGVYTENLTLKPYVIIKGISDYAVTVVGKHIIQSGVTEFGIVTIQSINLVNYNDDVFDYNTSGKTILYDCNVSSIYDTNSSINSVFNIQSGQIILEGLTSVELINSDSGSTDEYIDTIFNIGGNGLINLRAINSNYKITSNSNYNKLLLYNNTNSNTNSTLCFRNLSYDIILNNDNHQNFITSAYSVGSSTEDTINGMVMAIKTLEINSGVTVMYAYSTQASGQTKTILTNCYYNISPDGNIQDNQFYIGAATHIGDIVIIINCSFDTTANSTPLIYTLDGDSGEISYSIISSFGTYFNNKDINTDTLVIKNYTVDKILNENDLISNDASALPTQSSIKYYHDNGVNSIKYSNSGWTGTTQNVGHFLNDITDNLELITGTGYVSSTPLVKQSTFEIKILAGDGGFISYNDFYKRIIWDETTINVSGYTVGVWFVYVNSDNQVVLSQTEPNYYSNIYLGKFFLNSGSAGIGTINTSKRRLDSLTTRVHDFTYRLGGFVYDNSGKATTVGTSGDSAMKLHLPEMNVQYTLESVALQEITSDDFGSKFFVWYITPNGSARNYFYENRLGGKIGTISYNNPNLNNTQSSSNITFTQYSASATTATDLTSEIIVGDYIYLNSDTDLYMIRVDSINSTTITFGEFEYLGSGGTGTATIIKSLVDIPNGKYIKSRVMRDFNADTGNANLDMGRILFDSLSDALNGVYPEVEGIEDSIKTCGLILTPGQTTLQGSIIDTRPIPFNYATSSSGGITSHSNLIGLNNDDHLQYLLTNGSRDITGVIKYNNDKTFTNDNELISKKYVDNGLSEKSNSSHTHNVFNNNIIINGDLYVSGTTVTINTEDMFVKNNYILINSGETGSGVTKGFAGIEIDRGSLTNYRFIFDESSDSFKVGEIGNLQPVATREDNPTDGYLITWDSSTYTFKTTIDPTSFSLTSHTHNVSSILDIETYFYNKISINNLLLGKSNTGHTHVVSDITDISTYYYDKNNINTLLSGYTLLGHTHLVANITDINTYYYTKTNINNILGGYSTTGHTHVYSDITNLNEYSGFTNYYDKITINTLLSGKANTGETVSWSNISFSGSSIQNIEDRSSSYIAYNNTNWNVNNVNDTLNAITENFDATMISGRLEPITVLGGLNTNTLWVSGGTGFINYSGYHRKITWSENSYNLSGYSASTYYVYVSNDGQVNIDTIEPNHNTDIYLGKFYFDGFFIIVIQQSSNVSNNTIDRIKDYLVRIGGFIYDNGGSIQASGNTNRIVSSACKVQYGLLDYDLSEINTINAGTFTSSGMYQSSDLFFNIDYYFLLGYNGYGRIPYDRYNVTTNLSNDILTGTTVTFTQFSNTVTSNDNLTSLINEDCYIYLGNSAFMTPVSSVTWNGSQTTITLMDIYLGDSGSGEVSVDRCLPKLPSGKWTKHLVIRTTADNMAIIYGQEYFDSQEDAILGALPQIPPTLIDISIKMAAIVVDSGTTDFSQVGVLYDLRPLPFVYRNTGGGGGGGGVAVSHGSLTGLLNDDHTQYLLANGSRSISNVISYNSSKTFTNDNNLINKKYVDDGLLLKVNISGLTNGYYSKIELNDIFNGTTSITGYNKTNWDNSYLSGHTHSNKSYLDAVGNNTIYHVSNINTKDFPLVSQSLTIHTGVGESSIISGGDNGNNGLYIDSTGSTGLYLNNYSNDNIYLAVGNGNVAIGYPTFDVLDPERFLVYSTTTSKNLLATYANVNDWVQINIRNYNTGDTASSDICATTSNGTNSWGYVDLGIGSENYDFIANGFSITEHPQDAYLYTIGEDLVIGTGLPDKKVKFFTHGTEAENEIMRLDGTKVGINTKYSGQTAILQINDTLVKEGQTIKLISLKNDNGVNAMELYVERNSNIGWNIQSDENNIGYKDLSLNPLGGTVKINNFTAYHTGNLNISAYALSATTLSGYNITDAYTKTEITNFLNGKSNTGHTHVTNDITNLSSYSGFTNYYTKPNTDAQLIKGKVVDSTNISGGRPLVYDSNSDTIVYKDILDVSPSVQIRRTTDFSVTTSWSNVTFDTVDIQNKPTTIYWDDVNTDRVYILESGYYHLTFQTKVTCTTTTTQTSVQMLLNGTTVIDGSDTYVNVYQSEVHPLISSVVTYLSGGSYVTVQVIRNQTSSTLLASPRFIAFKMDGIIGQQGIPGSGSSLTIKNNSANVVNTPHTSLNFTGNIVSVSDGGSGVANVSINQIYGSYFQFAQDLTTTTTTSVTPTYATKLTINTPTLPIGTYEITGSFGMNKANTASDLLNRIQVDGVTLGNIYNVELSDTATWDYGTRIMTITFASATTHTITLQFSQEAAGTLSIRDSYLKIIRVQ